MENGAQPVLARDSSGRDTLRIVFFALAYFLAHGVALQFPDSQKILAAIWPAGGVGLAALLLSPRRRWPLILLALFIAGNSANLLGGRPVLASVGFMFANLAESLLCASLISYYCGASVRFSRTREVLALIVCAGAVNAVTAMLGAGAAVLTGGTPYWMAWRTWWVADGLGILLIAPLILAWSSYEGWFSGLRWNRALEAGLFLATWCAATVVAFQPYTGGHLVQPYMLVALLSWPVFRFGQRGVTAALVVAAGLAVTSNAVSAGPVLWGGADPVARLLAVQLFIAFVAGTALVVAASYTESQSAAKAARESLSRLQLALAERNAAEESRQASQSLLAALADATSDAIYVKDLQGRYLLFNRAAQQFTGKTAASVLGHDASFVFPAAEAAKVIAGDRTTIDRGTAATYEEVLTTADGRVTTFLSTKGPLVDAKGEPCGLYGVTRDITERKRAEEALRESEERFRGLFHASLDGIMVSAQGVILDANAAFARLFGYETPEELIGKSGLEFMMTPESATRVRQSVLQRVSGPIEITAIRKDGSRFEAETDSRPMEYRGVQARIASCRDITERKRAEQEAREGAARLALILEATSGGTWDWNIQSGDAVFSPRYSTMLGYDPEEFARNYKTWKNLVHPDDVERVKQHHASHFAGRTDFSIEFRMREKSGDWHWIHSRGLLIERDADGKPLRMVGTHSDIHQRKVAEEALRDSEERLRLILESSPVALNITRGTEIVDANPSFLEMFGFPSLDELKALPALELFASECRPRIQEYIQRHVQGLPVPTEYETECLRKDGTRFCVLQRLSRVTFADGPATVAFIVDITERKRAEELLRISEQKFSKMFHSNPVVMTLNDLDDGARLIDANEAFEEVTGYQREEVLGRTPMDIGLWADPSQLDEVAGQAALTTIRNLEYSFRTKTGEVRTGLLTSEPLPLGGKLCVVTATTDITERKRMEVALRESEERLRSIYTTVGDVIYQLAVEPEGQYRFVSVNPAFLKTTGLTSEMVIGKLVTEVIPEPALTMVLEKYRRAIRENALVRWEETSFYPVGEMTGDVSVAPVFDQNGACTHLVGSVHDITDRKRAEDALRESEERLRRAVLHAPFPLLVHAEDGQVLMVSETWTEITGYSHADIPTIADWTERAYGERKHLVQADIRRLYGLTEKTDEGEYEIQTKCGKKRLWEFASAPLGQLSDGRRLAMSMAVDVTERNVLEASLLQAQKLESVGRLAGGVAHDFNNLLTVINGYSGFLLGKLHAHDPLRPYAEHISEAGERAASLTKQLLAFSRKQTINPRIMDLNKAISDAVPMLQRMIGEDMALKTKLDPSLGQVSADPDQIYQVIMNLAVNARDAMPDGGELRVETANVEVDDAGAPAIHPSAGSGSYVLMTVTDNGHGMDDATREQIFEPFFTTKEPGKGTGLGLSTVYGIVRQSDGWITVQSAVGIGTSFSIYLPRIEQSSLAGIEAIPAKTKAGGERVLLVEDQDAVRSYAKAVLQEYGYVVVEASGGEQAMAVASRHPGQIQLLVTDVVLPGMNGKRLSEQLKRLHPSLKILFISGYTRDVISQRGVLDHGATFLQKPFSPDALAAKAREVLDTPQT